MRKQIKWVTLMSVIDGKETYEQFVPSGPTVEGRTPLAIPGTERGTVAILVDYEEGYPAGFATLES